MSITEGMFFKAVKRKILRSKDWFKERWMVPISIKYSSDFSKIYMVGIDSYGDRQLYSFDDYFKTWEIVDGNKIICSELELVDKINAGVQLPRGVMYRTGEGIDADVQRIKTSQEELDRDKLSTDSNKCTCDINDLFNFGCKCTAFERESS